MSRIAADTRCFMSIDSLGSRTSKKSDVTSTSRHTLWLWVWLGIRQDSETCAQTIGLVDFQPSIFIGSEVASIKTCRDFVFFSMTKISPTILDSNFQLRFLAENIWLFTEPPSVHFSKMIYTDNGFSIDDCFAMHEVESMRASET